MGWHNTKNNNKTRKWLNENRSNKQNNKRNNIRIHK